MRSSLILMVAALLAAVSLVPASSASAQDIPANAPAPAIPPIPWQLTSFPGMATGIEPGRYTVHFLPDGTVNIRADCNWVAGFWSGANGALDVSVTMTTVAECPAGSLEEPFVQGLDVATSYTFLEGMVLVIIGPAGEMRLSPAMPAMAWETTPAPVFGTPQPAAG
ncbi:MAG TPA: META domain-containing protein [Thermomicrobiales bacterium]|nr:META domain-containing protein [Thermomicrobiales bacterium]